MEKCSAGVELVLQGQGNGSASIKVSERNISATHSASQPLCESEGLHTFAAECNVHTISVNACICVFASECEEPGRTMLETSLQRQDSRLILLLCVKSFRAPKTQKSSLPCVRSGPQRTAVPRIIHLPTWEILRSLRSFS